VVVVLVVVVTGIVFGPGRRRQGLLVLEDQPMRVLLVDGFFCTAGMLTSGTIVPFCLVYCLALGGTELPLCSSELWSSGVYTLLLLHGRKVDEPNGSFVLSVVLSSVRRNRTSALF